MKLSIICAVLCILNSAKGLSAPEKATNVKSIDEAKIENVFVFGQKVRFDDEPSKLTKQLLSVAGIDGDPVAAAFSLPGVVFAGGDFGGEPAVRGSSPSDNAYYLDGIPATYIFHLFGQSIFNDNLIQDFSLKSGAFDASYGQATGAVFDVRLRDASEIPLKTSVETSFLRTGIFVEGSIVPDHTFYASYRHSLLHFFYREGDEEDGLKVFEAPRSSDYQLKYTWLISDKHKLTLSANGATDSGGLNISETSEIGRLDPLFIGDASLNTSFNNVIASHQWASPYGFLQTIGAFTNTSQIQNFGDDQFIEDKSNRFDFRTFLELPQIYNNKVMLGIDIQLNDIDYQFDAVMSICTELDVNCIDRRTNRIKGTDRIKPNIYSFYAIDKIELGENYELKAGFRIENDNFTGASFFHPRVGVDYFHSENLSFNARVGTYSRFPDIENIAPSIGNSRLKPFESSQISMGTYYELNSLYTISVDLYYKKLDSLARANENPQSSIRYTNDYKGTSYGAEMIFRKEYDAKWDGWLSLSYARTKRTDKTTNQDIGYFLDTPWIINNVVNYHFSDRWSFGARFTARAGSPYTPIVGIKPNPNFPDNFTSIYGVQNSEKLPIYFRLDLQASYETTTFGLDSKYMFGLLNATDRENISGFFFKPDGNETPDNFIIEAEEGIGIFPTIGIELSF